jgi:hypothetical protein
VLIFPFFFFWRYWGLNSKPRTCLPGTLLLEPFHQPSFVMDLFKIGCQELFSQGWLRTEILLIAAS